MTRDEFGEYVKKVFYNTNPQFKGGQMSFTDLVPMYAERDHIESWPAELTNNELSRSAKRHLLFSIQAVEKSINSYNVPAVQQIVENLKLALSDPETTLNDNERLLGYIHHLEGLIRPFIDKKNEGVSTHINLLGPIPKIDKQDSLFKNKEIAEGLLHYLSGLNEKQEQIMKEEEYNRLINYVHHLVEFDELPPNIKPITQTGVSSDSLRYTFYQIHKELFTTKTIRKSFINFLRAVFDQFKNTESNTIYKKFAKAPKKYPS